jgi:hypothetical protein
MIPFRQYVSEMVQSNDFQRYKDLDIDTNYDDDLYHKITLRGELRDYNQKQLNALLNYASEQLPGKTDQEIQEFMLKALSNSKTHEILRKHIAYHNPDLFDYIIK